jgi:hypothetical protein
MAMVSKERILGCVNNNLQALSCSRGKQENLIDFAELLKFSLKDVGLGLSHAIVMGGAVGRGDVWPLGWQEARTLMSADEVRAVEAAYVEIIANFPQDLKDSHAVVFA